MTQQQRTPFGWNQINIPPRLGVQRMFKNPAILLPHLVVVSVKHREKGKGYVTVKLTKKQARRLENVLRRFREEG